MQVLLEENTEHFILKWKTSQKAVFRVSSDSWHRSTGRSDGRTGEGIALDGRTGQPDDGPSVKRQGRRLGVGVGAKGGQLQSTGRWQARGAVAWLRKSAL